jgi:hypothetical protein
MNRWRTWIVVGAVGIVAALAVGDALRGNGGAELSPQAGATTATRPPTLRETLRRQHVSGVIDYSDEQCALHSLLLPNLTDEIVRKEGTGAPVRRCAFAVGAGRFLADDELISPDRTRVARCRRGHVEVLDVLSGRLLSRTPGCVPAWRPNGGLTYAHDGAVLEDGRVLYAQGELRRLARRHPNIAFAGSGGLLRVRVLALAWLERRFLAASLRAVSRRVEPQSFVVLLRGNRFLALDAAFAGPVRTLVASPTGSFVAEDQGTIISKEGRSFGLLESVPRPRRVVFSPDERWLAMATGTSVYLVGTPRNLGFVIRLPIPAQDLVWEPAGPTIDTTTTAR